MAYKCVLLTGVKAKYVIEREVWHNVTMVPKFEDLNNDGDGDGNENGKN